MCITFWPKSPHFSQVEMNTLTIVHLNNDISTRHSLAWNIDQEYLIDMNVSMTNLTCDDYMLTISARPSKVAEERTPREHLVGRSRKLV